MISFVNTDNMQKTIHTIFKVLYKFFDSNDFFTGVKKIADSIFFNCNFRLLENWE